MTVSEAQEVEETLDDFIISNDENPGITGEMRNTLQDWERRESSYGWI